jgi:hypothetical protein
MALPTIALRYVRPSGGRTWWAHFEFTRINIEPIILKNKIEDAREVGESATQRGLVADHLEILLRARKRPTVSIVVRD